jgi:glycogenin glucosyltransferase
MSHGTECVPLSAQVVSNIDDLFEREELSAAPDPGWPDCFNTGVFVFQPSMATYEKLMQYSAEHGSFDGTTLNHLLIHVFFLSLKSAEETYYLSFRFHSAGHLTLGYLDILSLLI